MKRYLIIICVLLTFGLCRLSLAEECRISTTASLVDFGELKRQGLVTKIDRRLRYTQIGEKEILLSINCPTPQALKLRYIADTYDANSYKLGNNGFMVLTLSRAILENKAEVELLYDGVNTATSLLLAPNGFIELASGTKISKMAIHLNASPVFIDTGYRSAYSNDMFTDGYFEIETK